MRCNDFHDRINDLLDERQDPETDVRIRAHAQSCDDCRRDLQNYRVFLGVYDQPKQVDVKPRSENLRLQPRFFWPIVAATLLLAVTFASLSNTPTTVPTPNVAVASQPLAPAVANIEPLSGGSLSGGSLVEPILGLTLVANADWSGLQAVEMPFGVHVPQLETDWIQGVADEMVPIKQSVDSTVALIVRTLST